MTGIKARARAIEALKVILPVVGPEDWHWLLKSEAVKALTSFSRSTVLRALEQLEANDTIVTKRGLGKNRRAVGVALLPPWELPPAESEQAEDSGGEVGEAGPDLDLTSEVHSTLIELGNQQTCITFSG